MKHLTTCGLALLLAVVSGCQEQKKPAPAPAASTGNPLTAPADYVGAIGQAQKQAQRTLSTVGLDQAIKAFSAEEGRLPKDLQELVTKGTIGSIPPVPAGMKYDYNPATGSIKVVPQ